MDPHALTHPDFRPGGPGWERLRREQASNLPDGLLSAERTGAQTIDELMEMTDMTLETMTNAPTAEQIAQATANQPPAPPVTVGNGQAAAPAVTAPAAPPASATAVPATGAADPVLDGKRRVAQALRAAYNTPGLQAALVEVVNGYEPLVTEATMTKLQVETIERAIKDREGEILGEVSGKNETERKANFVQARKQDTTILLLTEDLKNAEHSKAAHDAKLEAKRFQMRSLEAQVALASAQIRVLEGA